jgi:hypothetical protein
VSAEPQCPNDPPAYELLRQDEDYSYLRDDACRREPWDSLKYVRLGSCGDSFLTIGGEMREWYEGFRNVNWGVGPQDDNGYLLQRLSVHGDFHLNRRIRIFAHLTSAIEAGRNGGPRPVIDESKLFFEQAFADVIVVEGKKDSLVMRLGRREFHFGSGRLVDNRDGPNVRLAFDGIALIWKKASWDLTGFATKPVLNGTGFFDAAPEHGTTFWGVYAVRSLPKTRGGSGDNGNPNSPLGTFSPLFPTGMYFGQGVVNLNGPSNIIQVDPQVGLQITNSVTVNADNNMFWRTSLRDGVYGLATNLLVSGQGNLERYVGSQPSVGVSWQVNRHLSLSAAYVHFFVGPFPVKAVPTRRSVDYAAVWATYKF